MEFTYLLIADGDVRASDVQLEGKGGAGDDLFFMLASRRRRSSIHPSLDLI